MTDGTVLVPITRGRVGFSGFRADSAHGCTTFMEDQAIEVVGEVGQGQFGFSPGDTDCPDEQAKAGLLMGKDVLDRRAD